MLPLPRFQGHHSHTLCLSSLYHSRGRGQIVFDADTFGIIFSSPEHEVLMVSYCDQLMSVVRRVSCVVNNLF